MLDGGKRLSVICNQLMKVSTLRCRKVKRNMKFDREKSSPSYLPQPDLVKL